MDTLDAIHARRSIRTYLDRPVPEELIQKLLAAAVENMLLAAHALDLGAVWCGVYPREQRMEGLRWLIGLPETVMAHSLVVVGYPAEQVQPEDRYRPERIRRNRW